MDEVSIDYRSKYGFFEKQNAKDCLIHSINNAMGREVLKKQEVLEFIYGNADRIYQKWCGSSTKDPEKEVENYLSSAMLEPDTLFSAKVIWAAAVGTGAVKKVIKIPGFNSRYLDPGEDIGSQIPAWALKKPIVILGETNSGSNHAIAVRGGMIYDSEKKEPVPLTAENLRKSLSDIHAAFALE